MKPGHCIFAISLLCSGVTGTSALAASRDNWNTDGLNGGLTATATLTDSPCSLATESEEQDVSLGAISWGRLAQSGVSTPVAVHLILEDCLVGDVVRSTEHGDNVEWVPTQPVVMMQFVGEADVESPHLFRLYGSTLGAALHLEDAAHYALEPGERSRPQILNQGRNDLVIFAQLNRTSLPLQSGEFRAVVNLALEYH